MTGAADPAAATSIFAVLSEVAESAPERAAVIWPDGDELARLTYRQLRDDSAALAARLRAVLDTGDRVCVWAENCADWLVLEYAAAAACVVLVPLNPGLTDSEARFQLAQTAPCLLMHGEYARRRPLRERAIALAAELEGECHVVQLDRWRSMPVLDERLPEPAARQPFLIQFTSGTTGRPKGAVLSQYGAFNAAASSVRRLAPGDAEIWCSAMPMHHVGGSVSIALSMLAAGGTVVLMPSFDARTAMDLIARTRSTISGGVPTMVIDILDHPARSSFDLSSLRIVMIGGSNVSPSLIARVERELGVRVVNGYGQSEAPNTAQTSLDAEDIDKAETIGQANPGTEVHVVDPSSGLVAPVGEAGELCIRSPYMMSGYWSEPELTTGAIDSDGWLHTGDLVSADERGVLRFAGRVRDVVIRGGENIYPAEVEAVIASHRDVADVVVVGGPDERWGEVPVAFVRSTAGRTLDAPALEAHARQSLAGFKVPRRWISVDDLPLTASGKVQRFALRERLMGGR